MRFDAYDEEFDELARQHEELARQDEEEVARQEALRDHERLKTKNMKIVQQRNINLHIQLQHYKKIKNICLKWK